MNIEEKILFNNVFRAFLCLLTFVLAGCDELGDCQDAGGRWNAEVGECECTYEERKNYDIHISDEELEKCKKS